MVCDSFPGAIPSGKDKDENITRFSFSAIVLAFQGLWAKKSLYFCSGTLSPKQIRRMCMVCVGLHHTGLVPGALRLDRGTPRSSHSLLCPGSHCLPAQLSVSISARRP